MLKLKTILLCIIISMGLGGTVGALAQNTTDTIVSEWDAPKVNPPSNQHPRVYFTADKIDKIKENALAEENVLAKAYLEEYAKKALPEKSSYSDQVLGIAECKAFMYAVYGNEEYGKQAVDAIDMISSMTVTSSQTRRYGRIIHVLSLIYDWCNPIMDNGVKQQVIQTCINFASDMEIGWPPQSLGSVTGHGSEAQFLRDLMAFAIAVYDERPDIWNYIGGRFYAEFVPMREFAATGHYNMQGSDYGHYREDYTDYSYWLIRGMGAEAPYDSNNISQTAYQRIYLRRPDGMYLTDGDVYVSTTPPYKYSNANTTISMLMKSAAVGDGVLKNEYFKQSLSENNGILKQGFTDTSPALHLILNNPDVKASTQHNLPLSRYFGTPAGIMIARTGWENGVASDAVCALMKIGEYNFNNHQHLDSGNFEIYYKGALATESGNYSTYGNQEHFMYTSKSIAHNTMLVYDPDEDDGTVSRNNVNDGGQKPVANYNEFYSIKEFLRYKSDSVRAKVLAQEIDPNNTKKPDYTYLKGDLTNRYSDKVSDFKRSFMFLNLKNDEIPAALIVFDKVTSSNSKFKKTWLLHSPEKPEVNGDIATIINDKTYDDVTYNGRLTVKTLLPKADNLNTEIVGSPEDGWGIVNGYEYSEETGKWEIAKSHNYTTEETSDDDELNTYRLELSPKTPSETDYFLNVLLVSDAANQPAFEPVLIETDKLYGTVIEDRVVLFAKDGELDSFSAEVFGDGEYNYTICGVKPGKYQINIGDEVCYDEATEDGGMLSFKAAAGAFSIKSFEGEIEETIPVTEEEKETVNVKYNSSFRYPYTVINKNGSFDVSVKTVTEAMGYTLTGTDGRYSIYDGDVFKALIMVDNEKIYTDKGIVISSSIPYEQDGLMMSLDDLTKILGNKGLYNDYSKTIYISQSDGKKLKIYTGSCFDNGVLKLNAFALNARDINLYAAVYSGEKLEALGVFNKTDERNYTTSIQLPDDAQNLKIKIFTWGDMIPLLECSEPFSVSVNDGLLALKSISKGNLSPSLRDGVKAECLDGIYTFEKVKEINTTSIAWPIGTKYSLGENVTSRYVHYSANLEVIANSSNVETLQLRVRGTSGTAGETKVFTLTHTPGAAYRIDCIADLTAMNLKLYIDGILQSTIDISSWKNTGHKLESFEHYLVDSETSMGGEIQLSDVNISVYSASTDIDKIVQNIGNLCYK